MKDAKNYTQMSGVFNAHDFAKEAGGTKKLCNKKQIKML